MTKSHWLFGFLAVAALCCIFYLSHANPLVPAVGTDMNCPTIVGGVPNVVGITSDGGSMACFAAPTSMGPQGPVGPAGANGTNAVNFGTRVQTDATGFYAWTFPTGCLNAGNIPYISAIAEGPNPQAGVTVNPQIEGVPTATAVNFRVTSVVSTTVALLGLTILSVPSQSARFLDLTCAPK